MSTPGEVIKFWFDENRSARERILLWKGSDASNETVRERFEADVRQAAQGELEDWENAPESCLALVLLLDQFARRVRWESAKYLEAGAQALPIAMKAIRQRFDGRVTPIQRVFYYLPMVNCERPEMQARALALFEGLAGEVFGEDAHFVEAALRCSRRHKRVLERFGRFPERNEAMQRTSTPEEKIYLARRALPGKKRRKK